MASSTATTTIRTMAPNKRPPPPKGPPPKRPPPPPLPPPKKPAAPAVASAAVAKKRPVEVQPTDGPANHKQRRSSHLHIKAPVILRDVTVFQRRQQVGEGTYGYVSFFVREIQEMYCPFIVV